MRVHVPPDRTRSVQPLDLNAVSKSKSDDNLAQPLPELALSIEEARAIALEHNLDLQVSLLDPTIAKQSITEQEAKFEAILFSEPGDLTFSKIDRPLIVESLVPVPAPPGSPPGTPPTFIRKSALIGIQDTRIGATPGIRLPLTTGGSLTAAMPLSQSELDNIYEASAQFTFTQPLLRNAGPRVNTHAIRIARYDTMIAEARTKLQVMSVIADIDRLYWKLQAARNTLEVRKQEHELALRQLERARNQVKVGRAAEIEVTRAESGAAQKVEAIIIAENEVRQNQREIKRALNKPGLPVESSTVIIPTTPPSATQYILDPAKLLDLALRERMELLEEELQIAKSIDDVDFQRNQVLPLLDLSYTYGINGAGRSYGRAFDLLGRKDFEDHIFSVRAEVPLGNMAAKSALYRSLYTRIQRINSKANRERTIRREVLNAIDTMQTDWQRMIASRQAALLQARTLEAEQRQFEQGLRTSTDVLLAQTELATARLAETQAFFDYQIAQVDLAVATGTLLGAAKVRWEPLTPKVK